MSENNINETKTKTDVNSKLLKTKYGTNPTPGCPLISFLKTYHLKTSIYKMSGNGSPWRNLIP